MYSAKIITDNGDTIGFGYEYGVLFDISPLNGISVDINTSQGFQQIGTTVESMSVGGISRTIKGVFIHKTMEEATSMLALLPVFTTGKLVFNDKYYCGITVSKTPTISKKKQKPVFTLMVYCNDPFWYEIEGSYYSMGEWRKSFRFPVSYDSHIFATKDASVFVNCVNNGNMKTYPKITFTASSTVTNFGLINAETFEYMKINTTISEGEKVVVYRDNTRLKVEKTIEEETVDIFEYLDEYSDLYWIYPDNNILKMTADSNVDGLECVVSFNAAHGGVLDVS